ncbi:MAG: acyl-CoA dehydrogenase [Candidatus Rokuibacteriota bacterium]|nr:MAG: acyl-CoA dehydrogenase [Candidatus Rokubacteria bacterium]
MNFELTPEQTQIRAVAREFAEAELGSRIAPYDERHEFPHEIVRKLGDLGFMGVLVPPEYGGAGLDYVSYALIVEELNRGDASVGITMWAHNSLCTNHIALFGGKAQKEKYLPRLASGEWLGAWALTEPGSGSDAAAMRTRAVRDEGEWVLNGTKAFITNGSVGQTAVVIAITDPSKRQKGISAFILEKGMPGFSAGQRYRKLGLHASDTAELVLDNARVPAANLLGELNAGFVNTMQVLEGGRIAMAAMAVGIAQAALDEAVKYMKQRTAFGQTLAEFNGLQGMVAELATEIEAARLLTLRAAYLKDSGQPVKNAAAMAKLFASEVAMKAASKAVQIHGGAGYITDFPVERIFRDAKLTEIGEGTSEVQRLVIRRPPPGHPQKGIAPAKPALEQCVDSRDRRVVP